MRAALARLWSEQEGAILSAELIIIMTVLVIGIIVGVKSVRDAVVTELADVGQAISNLTQSFFYSSVEGHATGTGGSFFEDLPDFCDRKDQQIVQQSKCVVIGVPAANEGPNPVSHP